MGGWEDTDFREGRSGGRGLLPLVAALHRKIRGVGTLLQPGTVSQGGVGALQTRGDPQIQIDGDGQSVGDCWEALLLPNAASPCPTRSPA